MYFKYITGFFIYNHNSHIESPELKTISSSIKNLKNLEYM